MRVAGAEEVARALPYAALVDALSEAFVKDGAIAPPRAHHSVAIAGEAARTLLIMPSWDALGHVVVKLVNVVPGNGARGLPAIMGQVLVADGGTGAWKIALDGGELTARRTACASALAARHLAREDADTLFMVGAGRLARHLIAAHATQRPIRRVLVWARRAAAAKDVVDWACDQGFEAEIAELEDGARAASIISCATLSEAPLIEGGWLEPGVHLDLVGAFRPAMRETDGAAVARADVFVDTLVGAKGEAGDLLRARDEGKFDFSAIRADLAQLCAGDHRGRMDSAQVTLFKSVGASVEDYAAARLALSALG